ncbi:MAG: hemopexin repeat-containing protein [Nannocystaceae bacterium]|nr:hypothetical protein [Myxococcales bacterium]
MAWPWEHEFWRASPPPADPDPSPGSTSAPTGRSWSIDAAFADGAGEVHVLRGGRVISCRLAFGVTSAGTTMDSAEQVCVALGVDPTLGSALWTVMSGRSPKLSWGAWRPLATAFPGLAWPRVDAAVRLESTHVYFFRAGEFLCYDLEARAVRPGYPRPIAGQWEGLWSDGVEVAIATGRGKVFFLRDGLCSRYDIALQRVEPGFPRALGEVFPGLTWRRVSAAFCPGRAGEVVFLDGAEVFVYRDAEAARQLALAESEARARVEAVLGGDASELVEALLRARREDRSRGVARSDGFDTVLADLRRKAELSTLAASFAARTARDAERTLARLGAQDFVPEPAPAESHEVIDEIEVDLDDVGPEIDIDIQVAGAG